MIPSAAVSAVTGTAVAVAASETIGGPWGKVVTFAAVCTALTVIAHFTHAGEVLAGIRKLARLAHLQESFLDDWNGEPARPGVQERPSIPARLATVERVQQETAQRITDHRERNEATVKVLQEAVNALGRDQLIVETARAILTELGHDGELPPGGGLL